MAVVEELYETPSLEEVSKTIDSLRTGKASGMDRIPAEVIKSAKGPLLEHLHAMLCQCWEEREVPQDKRDCNIVILCKNNGDRSDCKNYRGISFLSIVVKIFGRVVLKRL